MVDHGMNAGHLWDDGAGKTQSGTAFFPIQIEEVFTSPDRKSRTVSIWRFPFIHVGQIVKKFWFQV